MLNPKQDAVEAARLFIRARSNLKFALSLLDPVEQTDVLQRLEEEPAGYALTYGLRAEIAMFNFAVAVNSEELPQSSSEWEAYACRYSTPEEKLAEAEMVAAAQPAAEELIKLVHHKRSETKDKADKTSIDEWIAFDILENETCVKVVREAFPNWVGFPDLMGANDRYKRVLVDAIKKATHST